jgi:hypothetical protein
VKNLFAITVAALFALVLVTGCSKGAALQTFDNSKVSAQNKSLEKVESAIVKGGLNKGWQSRKVANGQIEMKILVKGKFLIVLDALYDANGYTLQYKESQNLDYDATNNTIHPSYNKWVANLEREINHELTKDVSTYVAAPKKTAAPAKLTAASKSLDTKNATIYIKTIAPYAADAAIAENIKAECSINKQLVDFIVEASNQAGLNVVASDSIPSGATELRVVIADAVSAGNAFVGHRKYSVVHGYLVKGEQKYGSFKAARMSGGGFFGGYKGSCSVLGRTVKTIGEDIASWLVSPVDGAKLGDTQFIR